MIMRMTTVTMMFFLVFAEKTDSQGIVVDFVFCLCLAMYMLIASKLSIFLLSSVFIRLLFSSQLRRLLFLDGFANVT
jgi:hypothetical protein